MTNRSKTWLATALLGIALAGCGGSGSDIDPPVIVPPVVVTQVPDSAGVSGASFISFLLSLSTADETAEPLTITDTFAVPADEANEPTVL